MRPFLKNVSPRTLSIIGASLFSVLIIFGAYVTSGPNIFTKARIAGAQSTDELLRAFAEKDTDHDNLPDWQESLYNSDPSNPHSIDPTLTDGEAVAKGLVKPKFASAESANQAAPLKDVLASIPGETPAENTATAQFSKQFLQLYADAFSANGGQELSQAEQQKIVDGLMGQYTAQVKAGVTSSYTAISVHTSATMTLSEYAGRIEAVLKAHDIKKDADPVALMNDLVVNKNEAARPKIQALAAVYAGMASDFAAMQVPAAYAEDHLALMQSVDTLAKATKLVANYEKDPVTIFGSISAYREATAQFTSAFKDLAAALVAQGEPQRGQPGWLIVLLVRNIKPL